MCSKNLNTSFSAALLASLSLFGAPAAQALSCLAMGPGDVYRITKQHADPFIVLEGHLEFDESQLPVGLEAPATEPPATPQEPTNIVARFSGLMLGDQIFEFPVEGEMTLETYCAGPWCGSLASDRDYLIFARQIEGRGVVAVLDPCRQFIFESEAGEAGDIVLACHRGRGCPSELPELLEKDRSALDLFSEE